MKKYPWVRIKNNGRTIFLMLLHLDEKHGVCIGVHLHTKKKCRRMHGETIRFHLVHTSVVLSCGDVALLFYLLCLLQILSSKLTYDSE